MLPMMPRFTIERVRKRLGTSFPTAAAAVKVLEGLGIVTEKTGKKKNRAMATSAISSCCRLTSANASFTLSPLL